MGLIWARRGLVSWVRGAWPDPIRGMLALVVVLSGLMAYHPLATAEPTHRTAGSSPRQAGARGPSSGVMAPGASVQRHSVDPPPGNVCAPDERLDRRHWADYLRSLWEDHVRWSSDGATILFSRGPVLYGLTADGARIWTVADAGVTVAEDGSGTPRRRSGTTIPFDISPDGRHVVHATCRYGIHPAAAGTTVLGYELALVGIDGENPQRLTANTRFESYPAWSPDGERIAHVYLGNVRITPMGGESRSLPIYNAAKQAPAWSPDGRELAVATESGVVLVGADGANSRQITHEVVGGPAWSPDGARLAMVRPAGHEVALVTMATDGTDEQRLANFIGWPDGDAADAWMPTVAWSPDGSKILVVLQPGTGRPWPWDVILEPRRRIYVVTVAEPARGAGATYRRRQLALVERGLVTGRVTSGSDGDPRRPLRP